MLQYQWRILNRKEVVYFDNIGENSGNDVILVVMLYFIKFWIMKSFLQL